MCSVNQGMSGFGGRSCRDNEKLKVINFGEKNSKKEIFKLLYSADCPQRLTFSQELFFFSFHIVCLLGPFCTFPIKFVFFVSLREKEGELATTTLDSTSNSPCGPPSTELSDFRQSARSGNELECKQTLKNTCQRSWRHYWYHLCQSTFRIVFRCRHSNSRDAVASSPSFSRPTARAPPRACSHANSLCTSIAKSKTSGTIVE